MNYLQNEHIVPQLLNFAYKNSIAKVFIAISAVWLGRKVAKGIQNINPLQTIQNWQPVLPQSILEIFRKMYALYSYICPEGSTRRRLVSVIMIENGPLAFQISIGHLFYTTAAPPWISFSRKVFAAGIESILISVIIDTIKKITSKFFISPVREFIQPVA
ncbi:MAG: hypothetical protein H0W50_06280 [Parachlamydiaceae bacterium]|nr:hypothetical protein [Parachlamydiaceae bacterium]